MDDGKRYFWLKLKEDFFDDETIEWLEEQDNGKDYVLFYLKLCCKSLKNDGLLFRKVGEMILPYDVKKLAEITKTNVDTVAVALKTFKDIGLVDVMDNGSLFLTQISNLVGSQANNAVANRVRRYRERQKQAKIEQKIPALQDVTPSVTECNESIEYRDKSIELDNRDKNIVERDAPVPQKKRKQFVVPTPEEVQNYITEKGYHIDAMAFIDYYTSNGWMVGKNKMKDWKAAVRMWESREVKNSGKNEFSRQTGATGSSRPSVGKEKFQGEGNGWHI